MQPKYQAVFWFLLALPPSAGRAEDWPAFRGPDGNGHARGAKPPVRWSVEQNVTWQRAIPGEGWSSPVVAGNRVYLTAAVPRPRDEGKTDYSLRLLGLDAHTGRMVFDEEVFQQDADTSAAIHSKNSHASPTPLVDGDRVFVHFGHEGTACFDLHGRRRWANRELRYEPVHGGGGTPILVGENLIFAGDGARNPFVVSLDAGTGRVRWKVPRESDAEKTFSFSTASVVEVQGRPQVVTPGSNVVLALDPSTGATIWRVRYQGYSVIPKPVSGGGLVYIGTGYDRPRLLAIRLGGAGDITETHLAWTADSNVPHTPSLLLVGGELFMISDHGIASCLDAATGRQIWQRRVGGNHSASPVHAAGLIYFQSEEGTTTVVRAARDYEVVARNTLSGRTLASPAVTGGALLLRSDTHLFRIDER